MKTVLKNKKSVIFPILHLAVLVLWSVFVLPGTDSIVNAYVFVEIASMASVLYLAVKNAREEISGKAFLPCGVMSLIFALTVLMANYRMYTYGGQGGLPMALIMFFGALIMFYPLCRAVFLLLDNKRLRFGFKRELKPWKLFLISFLAIIAVDLFFLWSTVYPGVLTYDSMRQLEQAFSGEFINHHPFWHTIIITGIVKLGLSIFGEINAAIFLFLVCQIVFVSACFSFATVTVYQASRSKALTVFALLFPIIMPYNMIYSSTMWKDIPFGMAAMVFTAFLYRVIFNVGKSGLNLAGLAASSVLVGSWRTNGLIALAVTSVFLIILFIKKKKIKPLITIVSVLLVTVFMNTVFFGLIGVKSAKFTESLSIPLQQIGRTVHDGRQLETKDEDSLRNIIDYDSLTRNYNPRLSDPIKNPVSEEQDEYLKARKGQYLGLWMKIGLNNPDTYLMAWIDQTRGYWNGGYEYWRWTDRISDNSMGITRTQNLTGLHDALFNNYFVFWEHSFLNVALCIGLFTIFHIVALVYFISRRKLQFILVIPVLSVILTLLLASPVFSEFRYAYASFTCFPLILTFFISANIAPGEKAENNKR